MKIAHFTATYGPEYFDVPNHERLNFVIAAGHTFIVRRDVKNSRLWNIYDYQTGALVQGRFDTKVAAKTFITPELAAQVVRALERTPMERINEISGVAE